MYAVPRCICTLAGLALPPSNQNVHRHLLAWQCLKTRARLSSTVHARAAESGRRRAVRRVVLRCYVEPTCFCQYPVAQLIIGVNAWGKGFLVYGRDGSVLFTGTSQLAGPTWIAFHNSQKIFCNQGISVLVKPQVVPCMGFFFLIVPYLVLDVPGYTNLDTLMTIGS